jgi:S-(hydroxymethyl)glutathione dehydrogenase/alcohol dehydrogenase
VNGKAPELHKEIKKLTTEGQGVDFAFDAVGNVGLIQLASKILCKGGEAILVGIPHQVETFPASPIQMVLTEKVYRGSLGGSAPSGKVIPNLISLYRQKKLKLDELVTKTYSLREANDAMNDLREGKNARGVLKFV